ncbi:hypothetical protein WG909_14800 [Peptostreptococcaceae bacterium AGR-M142]
MVEAKDKIFKLIKEFISSYENVNEHKDIKDDEDLNKMYWQGVFICDLLEELEETKTYEYERICEMLDIIMFKK